MDSDEIREALESKRRRLEHDLGPDRVGVTLEEIEAVLEALEQKQKLERAVGRRRIDSNEEE